MLLSASLQNTALHKVQIKVYKRRALGAPDSNVDRENRIGGDF